MPIQYAGSLLSFACKMEKKKSSGCWGLALKVGALMLVGYGAYRFAYWALLPDAAEATAFFHSVTLRFSDHYTAVPGGAPFSRLVVIGMFTVVLWVLLVAVAMGLEKLVKRKLPLSTVASYAGLGVLVYSLVASLFIPKRLAVYDVERNLLRISNYQAVAYVWPNPIPFYTVELPFAEIQRFEYYMGANNVRGADHLQASLYALTTTDTILVGRTQYYHGEFGWITDWRSREEITAEATAAAEQVVGVLDQLIQSP